MREDLSIKLGEAESLMKEYPDRIEQLRRSL